MLQAKYEKRNICGVCTIAQTGRNMKIYDAHMHIDLRSEDKLYKYLENISGGNIIANSQEELNAVLSHQDIFDMGKKLNFIVYWHDGFEEQSQRWKKELGIKKIGIKLHPRIQNYMTEDIEKIIVRLEKVDFDNIIIDAFDVGSRIENFISLQLILELAKAYPDKKIIVAHAGGYRCLEYLLVLKDFKNLFYDISFTINYLKSSSVVMDIQHLLYVRRNKILFGTDFPEYGLDETLNNFNNIVQKMEDKEEIKKLVLYENYKNNF